MSRIFITGSTDGLGKSSAEKLLNEGHEVIVHARNESRISAVDSLVRRGAKVVIGNLSDLSEIKQVALNVNQLGELDAVINNAGIVNGEHLFNVNVLAPYLLSVMIRPERLIFLSSSMHRDGRNRFTGESWEQYEKTLSYSDSKMLVTALSLGLARYWPDNVISSVDPGWVPTRMGGEHASDDLQMGCETQSWLAVSCEERAISSGGYWHHMERQEPAGLCSDPYFQDALLIYLRKKYSPEI